MKIYEVSGESFLVPGNPRSHYATLHLANIEAANLVNILREETDLPNDAEHHNWKDKLEEARAARAEALGIDVDDLAEDPADDGYVEVTEYELEGSADEDGDRWRALMSSERIRIIGYYGLEPQDDRSIKITSPGNVTFGMEFWEKHPAANDPRYPQTISRNILTFYADYLRGK